MPVQLVDESNAGTLYQVHPINSECDSATKERVPVEHVCVCACVCACVRVCVRIMCSVSIMTIVHIL